jgi:hypothetical protein
MREGLLPHTVTTVLRLATTEHRARALTELLGEVLDPTQTAVSAFEIEEPGQRPAWVRGDLLRERPGRGGDPGVDPPPGGGWRGRGSLQRRGGEGIG